MKHQFLKYSFTLLINLTALFPLSVMASGLSVSPAQLGFKLADGKAVEQILVVANPTGDVMIFEVYPDEFPDIIETNPASFLLEAGGRKEVVIMVDGSKLPNSQTLSTNLSVVGKTLAESKVNVGVGAKITVTVSIDTMPYKSKHLPAGKVLDKPSRTAYNLSIAAVLTLLLFFLRRHLAKI